jgi:hypothetical protein
MIAVMLGVLITISSLMMAFFLAVANVSYIVENDFMTKAKQNAVMHALHNGQLEYRAKNFGINSGQTNQTVIVAGNLRKNDRGAYNNMTYNLEIDKNETIDATIDIK